ncbi:MAG: epimerase [Omnitrophica bacterium RIFCSPLOWO2_12_FULL_50_11]|nr:MAG: epimerase [Omnitrophica bacterium RIFCSPLOWO2_12_FULL_50_11]
MTKPSVGVLGATSMVGQSLLPLLANAGWHVSAFSRKTQMRGQPDGESVNIIFRQLKKTDSDQLHAPATKEKITHWVCLAPIWVLPDYFSTLTAYQAKRVIALSSTSVFTKQNSSDQIEQEIAGKLKDSEQRFIAWAGASQIEWVILRPTLIYGLGRDRNICEIARFVSRFGFFPLLGAAQGLRQPVHVEDVATACAAALQSSQATNHAYNLSGAEILPYREMVGRIFRIMAKPERFVNIPLAAFRSAVTCLRALPRFRNWSVAMAERMNTDLVFDHADAVHDLGFSPRLFQPIQMDLPVSKTDD